MKEVDLARGDLSAMRFWASTADAAHEAIQRRFVAVGGAFRSLGLPFAGSVYLDAQGSSEVGTPSVVRFVTPFTRRFGRRVGRPGSAPFGPQVRITRGGIPVRPGEVGRLEVKGRTVFAGYWNNHALTCEAFDDGWFFHRRRGAPGSRRPHRPARPRSGRDRGPLRPVLLAPHREKLHVHPAVHDLCV
jgi:acyl-CoA synthetase (AMP-forming)/AMP-acid ligase II